MTQKKEEKSLIHLDLEALSKEVKSTTKEVSKRRLTKEKNDETSGELFLGDMLRKARAKKNLDLEKISKKLCIKEVYLQALEEGKYYLFPGLAYGVGFLRSYANFLGLDANELIEKFHTETANMTTEPVEMPAAEEVKNGPGIKLIIIAVVLFLLGYVGWYYWISTIQVQTFEQILPAMKANKGQIVSVVETTETLSAESEQITEEIKTILPVNENKVYGQKTAENISLKANAEVWIQVSDENKNTVFEKILFVGDVYNPPKNAFKWVLKTGNAGAIDVFVENEMLGVLGKKGDLVSGVSLDPVNLKGLLKTQ